MTAPYDKSDFKPLKVIAFEALSVTSAAAVGFTATSYESVAGGPAIMAHVSVEGAQVRYRGDGTDPTASVGTILNPGDELVVWGSADIIAIKFIAPAGTSTLNVHYSR